MTSNSNNETTGKNKVQFVIQNPTSQLGSQQQPQVVGSAGEGALQFQQQILIQGLTQGGQSFVTPTMAGNFSLNPSGNPQGLQILQMGNYGATLNTKGSQLLRGPDGQIYILQSPLQQGNQTVQSLQTAAVMGSNGSVIPISFTSPAGRSANVTSAFQSMSNGLSLTVALPDVVDEEPLYVNAKQFDRILKRREARAKLESEGKIRKGRQKYLHESRHKNAVNRKRGEGGRFGGPIIKHDIDFYEHSGYSGDGEN